MEPTTGKGYCNVLAIQKALDPVGSAANFDDSLLIEVPLPWHKDIYERGLPPQIYRLMERWLEVWKATNLYRHRLIFFAPDPVYSVEGFRRVMYYTRQPGGFAQYDKVEYLVPEDQLGEIAWALQEAPDDLPRFDQYRVDTPSRDILVCTHGTVDAACAKFGYPLYAHMRRHCSDYANMRVWRVSHFGGHVYAPTLIDMPVGHYWAYIEPPQADQLAARTGDVAALRGHYRGWSGAEGAFAQALERELWQRIGWDWYDYTKRIEVLAEYDHEDEEARQWGEYRLTYTSPDGRTHGVIEARVEVTQRIETPYATSNPETYGYPQYAVTRLQPLVDSLLPAL